MKKFYYILIINLFIFFIGVPSVLAQAEPPITTGTAEPAPLSSLKQVGNKAGFLESDSTTILVFVGFLINIFLSLLGIIFIILILIAGYNWMTAAGDEEKIKKATSNIRSSIIGLLIIVGAFAIWSFISRAIFGPTV
ncbi:MAG: hypothetical protein QY321_04215 [Patescibacteria group bacterium]|nr:MAG: hypothetical protein QY321_04215 [Patescibacteria group bacterium]